MAKKVMVVDDDEEMFEYITTGLQVNGYNTVGTTEALKAIEMIHKENPDIIILDFVMPGIDGYSIWKGLSVSNVTKNIPILFITGHMTKQVLEQIKKTTAQGYMLKPFEVYDLANRIEKILSNKI